MSRGMSSGVRAAWVPRDAEPSPQRRKSISESALVMLATMTLSVLAGTNAAQAQIAPPMTVSGHGGQGGGLEYDPNGNQSLSFTPGGARNQPGASGVDNHAGGGGGVGSSGGGTDFHSAGGGGGVLGVSQGSGANGGDAPPGWYLFGNGGGGGGAACFVGGASATPAACTGGNGGNGGNGGIFTGGGGAGGDGAQISSAANTPIKSQLQGGNGGNSGFTTGIPADTSTYLFAAGGGGTGGSGLYISAHVTGTVFSGLAIGGASGFNLPVTQGDAASPAGAAGQYAIHNKVCSAGGDGATAPTTLYSAFISGGNGGGSGASLDQGASLTNQGMLQGGPGRVNNFSATNGLSGGAGGIGGAGFFDYYGVIVTANGCAGGNGGNGSMGVNGFNGTAGGAGAELLAAGAAVNNNSQIVGGKGANGSTGGTGGSGGNGGAGGNGAFGDIGAGVLIVGSGGNGGNGGNGGAGGNGGRGGYGGYGVEMFGGTSLVNQGDVRGGPGGQGGLPGSGGPGGSGGSGGAAGYSGPTYPNGTPGGSGSAGAAGSGGTAGAGGPGVGATVGDQITNHFGITGGSGGDGVAGADIPNQCGSFTARAGGSGGNGGAALIMAGSAATNDAVLQGGLAGTGGPGGGLIGSAANCTTYPTYPNAGNAGNGGDGADLSGGASLVTSAVSSTGPNPTAVGRIFGGTGGAGYAGSGQHFPGSGGNGGSGAVLSGSSTLSVSGLANAPSPVRVAGGAGGTGGSYNIDSTSPIFGPSASGAGGDGGAAVIAVSSALGDGGYVSFSGGHGGAGGDGGLIRSSTIGPGKTLYWGIAGGKGGNGGSALVLTQGTTLSTAVTTVYTGGDGGAGGSSYTGACPAPTLPTTAPWIPAGQGGAAGAAIVVSSSVGNARSSLTHQGSAIGGNGGVNGTAASGAASCFPNGRGGSGIVADGMADVIFGGSATGGFLGGSAAATDRASAIALHHGANRLELRQGWALTGNAVSDSGTTNGGDTLALGGDVAQLDFDLANLQSGGMFQGFAALEKSGSGTWILTGKGDFAPPTHVLAGDLQIDGILGASAVTVSGGTLSGTSSKLASLTNTGGIVAPGESGANAYSSLTTLSFSQTGGTLRISANGASASNAKLIVTGAANLGANLVVNFASPPQPGQSYTLLTASAISGTFGNVQTTGLQSGQVAQIAYNANSVTLSIGTLTVSAPASSFLYGSPGSLTLAVGGGTGQYIFSISSGSPPPGVTLNTTTGVLSGTPTRVGSYTFVVAVTDSNSGSGSLSYTLVVAPAVLVITADNASRVYGAANPTFIASYSGFVNADTAASLTMQPGFTTSAISTSAPGSYAITPSGAASTNYTISYQPGQLTITPGATTATITPPAAINLGSSVGVAVTVAVVAPATGTPTGTIQISDGGSASGDSCSITLPATSCSLTPSSTGSKNLTATYTSASANFTGSNGTAVLTVNAAQAGTVVSSSLNPSIYGQGVTLTATVTGQTPTGSVTFTSGSTALCSAAVLTGGGNSPTAACSTSAMPAGANIVTASYSGDANNAKSSGTLTQTVSKKSTTVSLAATPNPVTAGQAVTLTATVAGDPPTGTMSFSDNGASLPCSPVTLIPGATSSTAMCIAMLTNTGVHSIGASYAGDSNFALATSSVLAVTVNAPVVAATPVVPAPMLDRWALLLLGGLMCVVVLARTRRV